MKILLRLILVGLPLTIPTALKADEEPRSLSYLYVTTGYVGWQESIELVHSSGEKFGLTVSTGAVGAGLGYSYQRVGWEYRGQIAAFSGVAEVGSTQRRIGYFQRGVGVGGAILSNSIFFRPATRRAAFGLEVPILFRTGDFTLPSNQYSFENTNRITAGLAISARWDFQSFFIGQRFGTLYGVKSSLWAMDLGWRL